MAEVAYTKLRMRILDNVWAPGHQELEQDVAALLGMSRTPVREALVRLQTDGLIELIPRHGMRVLPVSPTDMREIYEVLTALECAAVEMVARRGPSAEEIGTLESATRSMASALEVDDLDAWCRADEQFHSRLVELSGNRHLVSVVSNYQDRAHRARVFSLRLRPKPVTSTREHAELVRQLRAGDAPAAALVNRQHRERASRELLAIFEHFKFQHI
jgi:DNA-binding GntR family transcriptional regulator